MKGWQRSLGASRAPSPHHRLTGEARTLKCLSAADGILHPRTQTSVACCPVKSPSLSAAWPFCSLPPQWGTPLPTTHIIQRTLRQEPWVLSLCCVPGSSAPYSGLTSARVGFLPLRGLSPPHPSPTAQPPPPCPCRRLPSRCHGPLGGGYTDYLC